MARRAKEWLHIGSELETKEAVGASPNLEVKDSTSKRAGIIRKLVVRKRCLNSRLIECEYRELESVRRCLVLVGKNAKFVKGMELECEEPVSEEEYLKPWVWRGRLPRRLGRW